MTTIDSSDSIDDYNLRKSMSMKRIKGRFGFKGRGLTYKWCGVFKDHYQRGRDPESNMHWDLTVGRAERELDELIAS